LKPTKFVVAEVINKRLLQRAYVRHDLHKVWLPPGVYDLSQLPLVLYALFSKRNPEMPESHANWWLYEDSRDLTETVWRELVDRHDRLKKKMQGPGDTGGL
jgi:hypothetical protein